MKMRRQVMAGGIILAVTGILRAQLPTDIVSLQPAPGESGRTTGDEIGTYGPHDFDTTQLWLELTNFSNGTASCNLHNGTNDVYAIRATTDLLTPLTNWNVEIEVWPTNAECQEFSVPTSNRDALFLRAEDWTGADSDSDGIPDWWIWKYYGDLNETATNLDTIGATLGFDYTNGLDPNVIRFRAMATNDVVNTQLAPVTLDIFAGQPAQVAFAAGAGSNGRNATWQPYVSSNIVVDLGTSKGLQQVWVGLKGRPLDAQESWQAVSMILETDPPALTVTNPSESVVAEPLLDVRGFADKVLSSLTYDVSNAAGVLLEQPGYLTAQSPDASQFPEKTNYFALCGVPLAVGGNTITLRAVDSAGNVGTTNFIVTLDYTSCTSPPALNLVWPPDGTAIMCGSFTLQARIDNTQAKVLVAVDCGTGHTNVYAARVQADGFVFATLLALNPGDNHVRVTAQNSAGLATTTNLVVTRAAVTARMDPLTADQMNQHAIDVHGSISDASYSLTVNGAAATVTADGTWSASSVPVSTAGFAAFELEATAPPEGESGSTRLIRPQASSPHDHGSLLLSFWQPPVVTRQTYETGWYYWQHSHLTSYTNLVKDPGTGEWVPNIVTQDCWQEEWNQNKEWWVRGLGGLSQTWNFENNENLCTAAPTLSIEEEILDPTSGLTATSSGEMDDYRESGTFSDGSSEVPYVCNSWWREQLRVRAGRAGAPGSTRACLVRAAMWDGTGALPCDWFRIGHQWLSGSGVTNRSRNAEYGQIWVTLPAELADMDATPIAGKEVAQLQFAEQSGGEWPFTDLSYWFTIAAVEIPAPAADLDRSGNINFDGSDDTSPGCPFRFWINDSQERGDIVSGADAQIPGSSSPNCNDFVVNGRSDLVNFFPAALKLGDLLRFCPTSNGYEYHLSQADGAVNFVYTSLNPDNAFEYLTNSASSTGYGVNGDEPAHTAHTVPVLRQGVKLDTNWLERIRTSGGVGILLVEGYKATTKPLMLEIWRRDNFDNMQKLGAVPMYLSLSGVEQMYRHLNLRDGADAPGNLAGDLSVRDSDPSLPTRMGAPLNLPDSDSDHHWFIFVVGSNVGGQNARGWESEVFKRMFWSGSQASYVGVSWYGDPYTNNEFVYDYHMAVRNAFGTAPALALLLNGLTGSKTIAGHSLGCALIASAMADHNMNVNNACLIDAAFAQECFDDNADLNLTAMQPSAWCGYSQALFAANWHQRFDATDARSKLTWRNRFVDALNHGSVYSFYSSTEDVLAEYDDDVPNTVGDAVITADGNFEAYVWTYQEKAKGARVDYLYWQPFIRRFHVGSAYGGWGFNTFDGYLPSYPTWYVALPGGRRVKTPGEIGSVTSDMLDGSRFNPLFLDGWGAYLEGNPAQVYVNVDTSYFTGPHWILGLYDPVGGNTIAADPVKRDQLLAEAIPALSLPTGARRGSNLGDYQFDMPVQFVIAGHWPRDIDLSHGVRNWWHSDVGQVAYPYLHPLYRTLASISNR